MKNRFASQIPKEAQRPRAPMSRLAIISQLSEDLKRYGRRLGGDNSGHALSSFPARFSEVDASLVEAKKECCARAELMESQGRNREACAARRLAEALEGMRNANSQGIWLLHRLLQHLSASREGCPPELLEQWCERMLLRQKLRSSEEAVRAVAEGGRIRARE